MSPFLQPHKLKLLGADNVALSVDPKQMAACPKQHMILDTVLTKHDVNVYLNLLKVDGSLVCAKHNITAGIELINMQEVNQAFQRLEKGQVKYRFVIDMTSNKNINC